MFGINGAELVVILLIAAVVVGPDRLPGYAEQLARWVRALRSTVAAGKERLSAELGEDDIDWAALDPRRYDPRRIVRDALGGDDVVPGGLFGVGSASGSASGTGSGSASASASASASGSASGAGAARLRPRVTPAQGEAPFDDEAT